MADTVLFVPFGYDDDFSLYKVMLSEDYSELSWSIQAPGIAPEIRDKLENLEQYFKQRHYKKDVGGQFVGISELDGSDFRELTPSTPSIFLGLFLAAACKMQRRKLRSSFVSVTVTGDLDYDENTGEMRLKEVGDIPSKYKAFEEYANGNIGNGKHLFVYVGADGQVLEGEDENIVVKRFSSKDSILKIMDDVFELYTPNMEIPNLDETQQRLLNGVNGGQHCLSYVATPSYEKNKQRTFSRNWTGFFIHGEGASGKSVMAEALIRDMMQVGRIYAPLWISVRDDADYELDKIWERSEADIYRQLNITPDDMNALERVFSEKQYLIVFDNLEMDITHLNSFLNKISEFFKPIYKNKPFLIITNRSLFDNVILPNRIEAISLSKLEEEYVNLMIRNLAESGGFLDRLDKMQTEEATEYDLFLTEIVNRLASTPGLIGPALKMLSRNTVREALHLLENTKDKSFRGNIVNIYESNFRDLPKKAQAVLFGMLDCVMPDMPKSKEELSDCLFENRFIAENELADDDSIKEALDLLLDYYFIYRTEEAGESKYAIKSHCFLVFSFEPEFAGELDHEEGKSLRERIMTDNSWKLFIALRYDRSSKDVEPILTVLKKDDFSMDQHLFTTAEYSSKAENLELLKKRFEEGHLEGNIDMQDEEDGESPFLRAVANNPHSAITEWFLKNLDKEAIIRKDADGLNALCHAVLFNTSLEIVKKLIDTGYFDPNGSIESDFFPIGTIPFLEALKVNNNLDICEYFLNDLCCDINELFYFDVRKTLDNPLIDEGLELDEENATYKNILGLRLLFRSIRGEDEVENLFKKAPFFPVFSALANPNVKILEKILSFPKFNAEIITTSTGESLLHMAARIVSQAESLDLIKKYGCSEIDERDKYNFTPFHRAALSNCSIPVFDWFEKNGADIHATIDGITTAYDLVLEAHPYWEKISDWFEERAVYTSFTRGDAYMAREQYDLAIAEYTKTIKLNKDEAEKYYYRGLAYVEREQYDLAITDFTEAIRLAPVNAEMYHVRADIYRMQELYDLAIVDYNKTLKLEPKDAYVYYKRGVVHCEKGQYNLTIKDFTRAIKLNTGDTFIYANRGGVHVERGIVYTKRGQYSLAIKDFKKALKLDPANTGAFKGRGDAYQVKNRYALAIADYTEAIRLDPADANVFRARGDIYRMQGKDDLADKDHAEADKLEQASGNP